MNIQTDMIQITFKVAELDAADIRTISSRLINALSTQHASIVISSATHIKLEREDAPAWEIKNITDQVFADLGMAPLPFTIKPTTLSVVRMYRPGQGLVTLNDPIEYEHEHEARKTEAADLPELPNSKRIPVTDQMWDMVNIITLFDYTKRGDTPLEELDYCYVVTLKSFPLATAIIKMRKDGSAYTDYGQIGYGEEATAQRRRLQEKMGEPDSSYSLKWQDFFHFMMNVKPGISKVKQ